MGASRKCATPSGGLRFARGGKRRPHRSERARDQRFRPRKPDAPDRRRAESPLQERIDVVTAVRERNSFDIGKWGWFELEVVVARKELTKQPVFFDRETVPRWKRKNVVVSVEEAPRHEMDTLARYAGLITQRWIKN